MITWRARAYKPRESTPSTAYRSNPEARNTPEGAEAEEIVEALLGGVDLGEHAPGSGAAAR